MAVKKSSVGLRFFHILKTVNLQQLKGMQCSKGVPLGV